MRISFLFFIFKPKSNTLFGVIHLRPCVCNIKCCVVVVVALFYVCFLLLLFAVMASMAISNACKRAGLLQPAQNIQARHVGIN